MFELHRRRFLTSAGLAAGAYFLKPAGVLWAEARESTGKKLQVLSEAPFNAEADGPSLVKDWITPLEYFYVRNHGPTPELQADGFEISVEGLVGKPRKWKLAELRELMNGGQSSAKDVAATLTCAGNRRAEMSAVKKIGGVQWTLGAIGNASWSGVPLRALLAAAEIKPEAKHVWFEGADPIKQKDGKEEPFGGSIPLADGWEQRGALPGAVLALAMNGKPLLPQHGFPARMVVPGFIGARSVKWLKRIIVSNRPSSNHFVQHAYKLVETESNEEAERKEPIYQVPINAAICLPGHDPSPPAGKVSIAGYALPPGDGSTIRRVQVSIDGGKSWKAASLEGKESPFCWRLWSLEAVLAKGKHRLIVRAIDSRDRTQPQETPWNAKGYLQNGWHGRELEIG